jgi:WD40 repeat protein
MLGLVVAASGCGRGIALEPGRHTPTPGSADTGRDDHSRSGGGGGIAPSPASWARCGTFQKALTARAVTHSQDGSQLAVGFEESRLHIYRLPDLALQKTYRTILPDYTELLFSPDGKTLVGAGEISVLRWAERYQEYNTYGRAVVLDHRPPVAFSPAGDQLLIGSSADPGSSMATPATEVWTLGHGLAEADVQVTSFGRSRNAAWADNGLAAVVVEDDGSFAFHSTSTGKLLRQGRAAQVGWRWQPSPDGRFLAGVIGTPAGDRLAGFSLVDGHQIWESKSEVTRDSQLRFAPGTDLVAAFRPGHVQVHHAEDGAMAGAGRLPVGLATTGFSVSPDGRTFAAIDREGVPVRFALAPAPGQEATLLPALDIVRGHGSPLMTLGVSRDGTLLASAAGNNTPSVWVWRVADRAFLGAASAVASAASLDFSVDGALLAVGQPKATSDVFRLRDGAMVKRQMPKAYPLWANTNVAAFSPDGITLAGGTDRGIELHTASTGEVSGTIAAAPTLALAYSPDGSLLATSAPEVWRLADRTRLWKAYDQAPRALDPNSGTSTMHSVAFSPDGALIVVSHCQYQWSDVESCPSTRLLRAADGTVVRDFGATLHRRPSFSRDGHWLVSGDQLVQLATGVVAPLGVQARLSAFVAGDDIAAAGRDGELFLLCRQ